MIRKTQLQEKEKNCEILITCPPDIYTFGRPRKFVFISQFRRFFIMNALIVVLVASVALAVEARPQSECEKRRENALKHETIMKLIPKCKENGDYEALQCYKDSEFCVCYDPKGHPASPLSAKIRKCDCHLKRHDKMKLKPDLQTAYLPQCDADGSYSKKQCWDFKKMCWCVDEQGNTVGKYVDADKELNCK